MDKVSVSIVITSIVGIIIVSVVCMLLLHDVVNNNTKNKNKLNS